MAVALFVGLVGYVILRFVGRRAHGRLTSHRHYVRSRIDDFMSG